MIVAAAAVSAALGAQQRSVHKTIAPACQLSGLATTSGVHHSAAPLATRSDWPSACAVAGRAGSVHSILALLATHLLVIEHA